MSYQQDDYIYNNIVKIVNARFFSYKLKMNNMAYVLALKLIIEGLDPIWVMNLPLSELIIINDIYKRNAEAIKEE